MKLNKHSKVRTVGLSSSFALLALLGLAAFCPSSYDNAAHAVDDSATFELDFILQKTASATFTVDFLLAQQLSISMSDLTTDATASVTPTASGAQQTAYKDFTVSTNSTAGLGIYVYGDGDNTLVGQNTNKTIPSVTSDTTLTAMTANRWGYDLSEGDPSPESRTFKQLPANKGSVAGGADNAVTNKAYRLSFGAKVDLTQAPDTYKSKVNVQVIPSSAQTTAINEAGNMLQVMQENNLDSIDTDTYILDIVSQKD